MSIGEQIRKYRIEMGLSQKELGEKLGVSQAMIAQYENGKRKPKLETQREIAYAIGIPLSKLNEKLPYYVDNDTKEGNELLVKNLIADGIKMNIITAFNKLNYIGQKEAEKRVTELTEIPRYTQNNTKYTEQVRADADRKKQMPASNSQS